MPLTETLPYRAYRRVRDKLGYDSRNWLRLAQIEAFEAILDTAHDCDVLEVSPGWNEYWKMKPYRSYTAVDYPDFDICRDVLPQQFDIVIADQVLEHVPRPLRAVRHMYQMTRPGGLVMVAAPFLFRVHGRPYDYNRWTADGLRELLVEGGFSSSDIHTASWGNKACARAHIGGTVLPYGFRRDMSNDPEYPLMVWAMAQRERGWHERDYDTADGADLPVGASAYLS